MYLMPPASPYAALPAWPNWREATGRSSDGCGGKRERQAAKEALGGGGGAEEGRRGSVEPRASSAAARGQTAAVIALHYTVSHTVTQATKLVGWWPFFFSTIRRLRGTIPIRRTKRRIVDSPVANREQNGKAVANAKKPQALYRRLPFASAASPPRLMTPRSCCCR